MKASKNQRDTTAKGFLKAAWGHRAAAQILEPHAGIEAGKPKAIFFAFYNVLGLSVELYLKGFLRTRGIDSVTLSHKPFGHDVDRLLKEALDRDIMRIPAATRLPFSEANLRRFVSTIGQHYAQHKYRYLDNNTKKYSYIKNTELLWPMLDHLQGLLEMAIFLEERSISIDEIADSVAEAVREWRESQKIELRPIVTAKMLNK